MAANNLEWVTLREFRGLWEQTITTPPLGAATQLDNCHPVASGEGIMPAFKTVGLPALPDNLVGIAGIFIDGPISANVVTHDLWAGGTLASDINSVRFFRLHGEDPGVAPSGFKATWQTYHTHVQADGLNCPRIEFASFRPSTANTAQPVVVAANSYRRNNGYIHLFPDPASPALDSALLMRSSQAEAMVQFNHRLVWAESRTASHTARGTARDANTLMWTDRGATAVPAANFAVLSATDPSWIAFLANVDVDDLFVMKFSGAYLVQGDLGAARQVKLANVPGAPQQVPAVSPWGLIYGVASGPVVAWQGGAGAESISQELNPDFWSSPFPSGGAHFGGFEWGGPFLFAPNGYVWDSRTKAWWKHSDLSDARLFSAIRNEGVVVSAGSGAAGNFKRIDISDDGGRVSSWTWRSTALAPPSHRPYEVREVELLVRNWNGVDQTTFTVTIGGEAHVATLPVGTTPRLLRFHFHAHQQDALQVTVAASAGAGQAGILKEIKVGHRPGTQKVASTT